MSKTCPLVPGRAYSLFYPSHNYQGLPQKLEPRRLRVAFIRDLKTNPLDQLTSETNPTLKRGRWLVTGEDIDKGEERSFYLESMSDITEISDSAREPEAFAVIVEGCVRYRTDSLSEAMAFRLGRNAGSIFGRMSGEIRRIASPLLPTMKSGRRKR